MRTKLLISAFLFLASFVAAGSAQQPAKPPAKAPAKAAPNAAATPRPVSDEQRAAATVEATMSWEKSSSAGVKATTTLLKKAEVRGHQAFEYRLKVSGAPHNQIYKLMVWPITMGAPVVMMDGLVIAQDGTVGCPADSTNTLRATLQRRGAEA